MIDRIANPRIRETRNGRNGIPWRLDRFARARGGSPDAFSVLFRIRGEI